MQIKVIPKLTLPLLARWRLARLAARLLLWVSRPLPRQDGSPRSGKRPCRVLVLNVNKSGLLQDLEDSLLGNDDFELICWPSYALKAIADEFLPPLVRHGNYSANDPASEASKQAYREFLARVWRHFSARALIDVVISANFGYYAQREFGAALQEAGTPFIVLQKENLNGMSPWRRKFWFQFYKERRGKFEGRKILVYNDIERELEISSGVVDPQGVAVTGMARLDRIHKWRRENAGRASGTAPPKILFFGFGPKDKLPIPRKPIPGMDLEEGDLAKLSWKSLCEDTHKAIVELARMRPDFRVTIKTKGLSRQQADILAMLGEDLPPNLTIVTGGDPFPLLAECRVAVGFNTTALLEAMAAGKPVIVPWFHEACDEAMLDHVIDLGDVVNYASSPKELIDMICRLAEQPAEIPSRLSPGIAHALKHWVGNDDGAAGQRVVEAIRGEVASSKASTAAN